MRKGNRLEWSWDDETMKKTILFAVLLHNMCLDLYGHHCSENGPNGVPLVTKEIAEEFLGEVRYDTAEQVTNVWPQAAPPIAIAAQLFNEATDQAEHFRLRNALIDLR